ncbi:hypothetical protein KBG31_00040 [Patescibacteria group bacterium]|nr:hypothetical protein [Patescibacteria group bacterium]HOM77704.1 hypothetical protein [bacterium]
MEIYYRNKKEYAVFAMRRSGHHAIMEWVMANTLGKHCFLNDCDLVGNPFETYKGGKQEAEDPNSSKDPIVDKDLLIYNFEDMYFSKFSYDNLAINHDSWLVSTQEFNTLLVLRDPFNLFASMFKWFRGEQRKEWKPSIEEFNDTPNLWIAYAKEYLGLTNILKDKIVINYNEWFESDENKKNIAILLGLPTHDKGYKRVAKYGANTWGDSFDNINYDNKAHEMTVFERWKSYKDDQEYISMLNNPELLNLAEKIYPKLTKEFLEYTRK